MADKTKFKFGEKNRFKVGSFTRDTALPLGDQAVSGVGFKPKAVYFFMAQESTIGEMSLGIDDGSISDNCGCVADCHHIGADVWAVSGTFTIQDFDDVTGKQYYGYVKSMDSDGFTVRWNKVLLPTGTIYIAYLAMR